MNEPRRLRDEGQTSLERALLEAGRSYRSPPETRVKTLGALGLTGSALSATTAKGAGTSWATSGWVKLLLPISALGAATAIPAGYFVWQQSRVAAARSTADLAVVAPPAAGAAAREDEPAPLPAATVEPIAGASPGTNPERAAKAEPRTSPAPPAGPAATPAAAAPGGPTAAPAAAPALSAEIVALDAARAALARGDAVGALALLDRYARTYPRGRLELEAEVLRIDALANSGQTSAAKSRAATFLRQHPSSLLASRVRRYASD
jgi:hypothetical protein